jgi:hypothetical protein
VHPTDWTPATSGPGEIHTPEGRIRSTGAFVRDLRNRRRIMTLDRGGFSSTMIATLMLVLFGGSIVYLLGWLLCI